MAETRFSHGVLFKNTTDGDDSGGMTITPDSPAFHAVSIGGDTQAAALTKEDQSEINETPISAHHFIDTEAKRKIAAALREKLAALTAALDRLVQQTKQVRTITNAVGSREVADTGRALVNPVGRLEIAS